MASAHNAQLKRWMHQRPNARRWKARFKMGQKIPRYALEEFPKLKRIIRESDHLIYADGYQKREFMDGPSA